jgi:hypothetical protein
MRYVLTFLIFFVCSSFIYLRANVLDFCLSEYEKIMRDILLDDEHDLVSDYMKLTTLKLSLRYAESGDQNIKDYIQSEVKRLASLDDKKLKQRIDALYKKIGQSEDFFALQYLVEEEKKGTLDLSAWSFDLYGSSMITAIASLDDCEGSHCLNDSDVSIIWFYDKVNEKVYDKSYATELPHFSPFNINVLSSVQENMFIPDKLKDEIEKLEEKLDYHLNDVKEKFFENYSDCKEVYDHIACFEKVVDAPIESKIDKFLKSFPVEEFTKVDSIKLGISADKTLSKVVSDKLNEEAQRMKDVLEEPDPVPEDSLFESIWERSEDEVLMCGGEQIVSGLSITDTYSFDFSKLAQWQGDNSVNDKNTKRADKLKSSKMFDKFCSVLEKVGPFRCTAFVKTFILNYRNANKNVCCNDEEVVKDLTSLSLSAYGGIEGKLSIPDLLMPAAKWIDIFDGGVLVGLGLSGSLGASVLPNDCLSKYCADMVSNLNFYAGAWAEVTPLKTGLEMKVSWKPYILLRKCILPDGKSPMTGDVRFGTVWAQGTIYLGWLVTYDFRQKLLESNDLESFSFHLF